MKRRVELLDDDGNHLTTVDAPADTAGFDGADFSGLTAPGLKARLRFQSLRGAQLYWAMLQNADLSGCNLEGADLRGANLRDVLLVGANLRNADLSRANLGGSTLLQGTNLTDAVMNTDGVRATKDVDAVVEATTLSQYHQAEKKLDRKSVV